MSIYIYTLVLLIIANIGKGKKYSFVILCLLLTIIMASRDVVVGRDLPNYIGVWQDRNYVYSNAIIEPGIIILGDIIRLFSDNNFFYITTISLLILVPVFIFFALQSTNPVLSLLVYYILFSEGYFFAFSGLRQALATCFLIWFVLLFFRKKWFFSLLLLIIAFFFHHSSVFVVLFLVLSHISANDDTIIFLIVCSAAIGILISYLSSDYLVYFANIPVLDKYIRVYADYSAGTRTIFGNLSFIIPFSWSCIVLTAMKNKDRIFYFFAYSVIIQNLFVGFPVIHRFVLFGILLLTILLPRYQTGTDITNDCNVNIFEENQTILKNRTMNTISIIFMFILLLFYNFIRISRIDYINDIIPYYFYNTAP